MAATTTKEVVIKRLDLDGQFRDQSRITFIDVPTRTAAIAAAQSSVAANPQWNGTVIVRITTDDGAGTIDVAETTIVAPPADTTFSAVIPKRLAYQIYHILDAATGDDATVAARFKALLAAAGG